MAGMGVVRVLEEAWKVSGVEKDLTRACFLALSVTLEVTRRHLVVAFVSSSSCSQFLFFLHTQNWFYCSSLILQHLPDSAPSYKIPDPQL